MLISFMLSKRPSLRAGVVKFLPLSILLLAVSACGFQLKGQGHLPAELKLSIIELDERMTPTSALVIRLRQLLQLYGAELTTPDNPASARILLSNEMERHRTLASGSEGNAREFTLTYSVTLQVLDNAGAELLAPTQLSVSRDLLYRSSELLGALGGVQLAQREMASELANSIVRRLQAIP